MTKNQVIQDIAKYHVEWVRFVYKNSLNLNQKRNAEDYVQDAYIKILKYSSFDPVKFYQSDGKINKKYFFRTLKSILIDDNKKKAIRTVSLNEKLNIPDITEIKQNLEVVFNKIEKTINNMYWYDKKMLNLYVYHIPSIRKISTATTISSKSVFKTLKRCKLTIKKEVAKEYYYGKTG
tara:strand:- start:4889 stop:5422 length:534 start_codon:yes stop_codon:yes gene_type:complete